MLKKTILLCAVLCLATACALDAGEGKSTQIGTAGAGAMKITITVHGKTLVESLYDNSYNLYKRQR